MVAVTRFMGTEGDSARLHLTERWEGPGRRQHPEQSTRWPALPRGPGHLGSESGRQCPGLPQLLSKHSMEGEAVASRAGQGPAREAARLGRHSGALSMRRRNGDNSTLLTSITAHTSSIPIQGPTPEGPAHETPWSPGPPAPPTPYSVLVLVGAFHSYSIKVAVTSASRKPRTAELAQ